MLTCLAIHKFGSRGSIMFAKAPPCLFYMVVHSHMWTKVQTSLHCCCWELYSVMWRRLLVLTWVDSWNRLHPVFCDISPSQGISPINFQTIMINNLKFSGSRLLFMIKQCTRKVWWAHRMASTCQIKPALYSCLPVWYSVVETGKDNFYCISIQKSKGIRWYLQIRNYGRHMQQKYTKNGDLKSSSELVTRR